MAALVATAVPDGGEVLLAEGDFSSMTLPFAHAGRGVRVRTAPLPRLAEEITSATDLVVFSLVQSATGDVADADAVVAAAHRVGALTLCDATQAVGWMPVDAGLFDAVVCHAYKWLCAPRGACFAALSPRIAERMTPLFAGWYAGDDPWSSCYGLDVTLADSARRFRRIAGVARIRRRRGRPRPVRLARTRAAPRAYDRPRDSVPCASRPRPAGARQRDRRVGGPRRRGPRPPHRGRHRRIGPCRARASRVPRLQRPRRRRARTARAGTLSRAAACGVSSPLRQAPSPRAASAAARTATGASPPRRARERPRRARHTRSTRARPRRRSRRPRRRCSS